MTTNRELFRIVSLKIKSSLTRRLSLQSDQLSVEDIDLNIRDGIEIKGTNLWVLMLAIFIASIGLDLNSTAVVIGAMLISPLMGPIMGIGYGAGINDFHLIKKALGNFLISIFIALLTSAIYFTLSPLSSPQSELLARTTPTIWDVLIALFGGMAGIIATTRKEKSNVIPGVAIATALMPPLCTAGYGIANGSASIFFGAFYLFFINGVFIALAALIVIGYIHPPHKKLVNSALEARVRLYIYVVVIATVLPSTYLAYGLVKKEVFNSRANDFIKHELLFDRAVVAKEIISPETRTIDITLVGQQVSEDAISEIVKKLPHYKLPNVKLNLHQSTSNEITEASLTKSLLASVLGATQGTLDSKNKQIQEMDSTILKLRAEKDTQWGGQLEQKKIFDELVVLYPQIQKAAIAKTTEYPIGNVTSKSLLLVYISSDKPLSIADQHKITAWLKARTDANQVALTVVPL